MNGPDYDFFVIRFEVDRQVYMWADFGDYLHKDFWQRKMKKGWKVTNNWEKAHRFESEKQAWRKMRCSYNLRELARKHPWEIIRHCQKTMMSSKDSPLLQLARCAE